MLNYIRALYVDWTEALLQTRISEPNDPSKHGALYCEACGIIHGRCQETITAFLEMARQTKNPSYINVAENIFTWADHNLSQDDGSFLNDTDSSWVGTTVFNVIHLLDALEDYSDLISHETATTWRQRTLYAANFLRDSAVIESTVINYAIGNAYAMWRCWKFYGDDSFHSRYLELKDYVSDFISVSDLIFGEGANKERSSSKGCKAIDIGYNLEESLPLLTRLAIESEDKELIDLCRRLTLSHQDWVLSDGIVDNSFGSRNYKWTVWGSRTTDGLHLPFFVFADPTNSLATKAMANLKLLRDCTHDGFLYGGLHNSQVGEGPCLHHAITHMKALVVLFQSPYLEIVSMAQDILLQKDKEHEKDKPVSTRYFPELDTYRIYHHPYTSTLTAYDWHYVYGGHITGGSLSLLHHEAYGLLTASSMNSYHRQEFNNMQEPTYKNHDSLSPRLMHSIFDAESGSELVYSSAYDHEASLERIDDRTFIARGYLRDLDGQLPPGSAEDSTYEFRYSFDEKGVTLNGYCKQGIFILSLIADPKSKIVENRQEILIQRDDASVRTILQKGFFDGSSHRHIFNHVPGIAAYETHILPEDGEFTVVLSAEENELAK